MEKKLYSKMPDEYMNKMMVSIHFTLSSEYLELDGRLVKDKLLCSIKIKDLTSKEGKRPRRLMKMF